MENNFNQEGEGMGAPMSKKEMLAELGFVRQQCAAEGNNDVENTEVSGLTGIIKEITEDKVDPKNYAAILYQAKKMLSEKIQR